MKLDIKRVLETKNISVAELERLTERNGDKLSRVSIFKILNEETSPKLETIVTLAKALDVELFDLFSDLPATKDHTQIFKKDQKGNYIEIGYLVDQKK